MQKLKIAGGLNRVFQNMEGFVTCILSGHRDNHYEYNTSDGLPTWESLPGKYTNHPAPIKERRLRNEILEKKLKESGLGFNKCAGGFIEKKESSAQITEYSFIVYNNRFNEDDFIKLMIYLGSKFDQDSILITKPVYTKDFSKLANIEADYYVTSPRNGVVGSKEMHFKDISMSEITKYFTRIYGREFKFVSMLEPELKCSKPSGSFAMNSMEHRFAKMYPFLRE